MKKSTLEHSYAPHISLILVQLLFGSFPVFGKFALQTFPALGIVAFRIGGAAIAFYFLQRFSGSLWLDRKSDYARFFLYSILGVVLNQILFVRGLSLTTATNTSLLAVLIPVFAVIISALFKYEKFTWSKAAGIILAAGGVVYLIDPSKASFSSQTTQGDLMIVLNSLSYAIYLVISKDAIMRNGALRSIAWLFFFGSLVTVPLGFYEMRGLDLGTVGVSTWLAILYIVLFPTAGAYFLNAWAIARVQSSVVAVYVYLQPLIGAFLAITVLGEQWQPRILLAMLLIFAGVYLVTRRRKTAPEVV